MKSIKIASLTIVSFLNTIHYKGQQFSLKLIFSTLLFLSSYTEGTTQCSCTDCRCSDSLELVKLYNATDGTNWVTKWDLTRPMESWLAVTLENNRVVRLTGNGNMKGGLPNLSLQKLYDLNLSNNELRGEIPSFNMLPNLKYLDLSFNKLSGPIPNFNQPNLSSILLHVNNLTGTIPNFILPNLANLSLGRNQLIGAIPSFNNTKMSDLFLGQNQLTGAIPNFNLPNLQILDLGFNQLTGTIPNFNLPNLERLWLHFNQLRGSIPNFNLPNLENINLSSNQLSGSIPNFNLPNLRFLVLEKNQLSGCIPKEIKINCPHITEFYGYISDNPQLSTQSWANYWNNNEGACSPTFVSSTTSTEVWQICPNPAYDILSIKGSGKICKIMIYNTLSHLVSNFQLKDNTVDISQLNKGIYIIRIISDKADFVQPFLKE